MQSNVLLASAFLKAHRQPEQQVRRCRSEWESWSWPSGALALLAAGHAALPAEAACSQLPGAPAVVLTAGSVRLPSTQLPSKLL